MTKAFVRRGAIAVSMIALIAAGTAWAQTAPADAVDSSEEAGDIVVTAQKRTEKLQDVPISIIAVAPERLQASKIDSVTDLGRVVPGFATARSTQVTGTKIYVRGIGGGGFAIDPSVAPFIDDVYIARPGAILGSLYDVSSVEVLRGPQGTLFGRNASAGALSIRTTGPSDNFGGYANAEFGNYGAYKLEGALDLPANDTLAFRVAGLASGMDGYAVTNIGNHRYGSVSTRALRGTMRFEPSDTLSWTVRADYLLTGGDGMAQFEIDPRSLTPAAIANLTARLRGNIPDIVDPFDRRSNQLQEGELRDRQYGISSDLNLQLGDFNVRLINAARHWDSYQRDNDLIQTPLPIIDRSTTSFSGSHSHELQLISPADQLLDGRLNFVGGLYYFRERFENGDQFNLQSEWCGTIIPLISAALVPSCLAGAQTRATISEFEQVTKSFATYGQATFKILPNLEFTAGGRYTKDQRDGGLILENFNTTMALVRAAEQTDLEYEDDRFTYRLNLSFKPTPDLMVFGTVSTGFKAGAFNSGTGTPALGQKRLVGPERAKNYEIGIRSQFLDRRLTLNATLYRLDVKGFQDRGYDGVTSVIRNAGDLRHQGFEADARWQATRGLSFSGGVQYLDSEFTDYKGAPGLPGIGGTQNLTGKSATFTPKWQGNAAIDLAGDLGSGGWSYALHSDVTFQSDSNIGLTNDNNPQTIQKGYALLGAQASITLPGDRVTFSIYGQNLTGKDYCSQYFNVILDSVLGLRDAATGGTGQRCVVGAPRTFGGRLGYRF